LLDAQSNNTMRYALLVVHDFISVKVSSNLLLFFFTALEPRVE